MVPYYDYALDMVLDVEMPMEDSLTGEQQEIVESAAEMLYGLIHARFIITNRGMHAMYEKYRMAHFGRCPHVFCQGQPVLPVGLSDLPRNYTVNVFCPRCHGLFFPKSTRQANIDGAYFGTTFPHLYLMTHPVCFAGIFFGILRDCPANLFPCHVAAGHGSNKTNANIFSSSIRLSSSRVELVLQKSGG